MEELKSPFWGFLSPFVSFALFVVSLLRAHWPPVRKDAAALHQQHALHAGLLLPLLIASGSVSPSK